MPTQEWEANAPIYLYFMLIMGGRIYLFLSHIILQAVYSLHGAHLPKEWAITSPEERCAHIYEHVDEDHNGRITYQEFLEGAKYDEFISSIMQIGKDDKY